ncbi:PREDICTED: ubiquitin carboxyl-terminal hydrolase 47-like isoform X2 [Amphimedon queenslandica]|uniref:Ubiquitin-like domain-containing protein n=1 Tax=Amphimedon queenslandica TaxID=400682 RepID=A0AAN0IVX3_AMPQE|nr:PREDICTED: ubiquitin carboxyl-terminal hydrolase 47-like isoform X2 [Amphimedon queenslandica]|eukprot:XP_019848702.1 PREDICTED: ubiquitin carboxyl-terminal hydrolase 47-like isoform X2 [Amphimedon queenslandica]
MDFVVPKEKEQEAKNSMRKSMKLAPHIPIERCRLVRYYYYYEAMDESFDLEKFQDQTIDKLMGMSVDNCYCSGIFLQTRKENENFKVYNIGGINLKVSVIEPSNGEVSAAKPMRAEHGWTVGELKQCIGKLFDIDPSCMRLVLETYYDADDELLNEFYLSFLAGNYYGMHLANDAAYLREVMSRRHKLYALSDFEDYQREYNKSLMHRYVTFHLQSVMLHISMPSQPERRGGKEEVRRRDIAIPNTGGSGEMMMKIVSVNEGRERKIQIKADNRISFAQLKEKLVPMVGVPAKGFRLFQTKDNQPEQEILCLSDTLAKLSCDSKIVVKLGKGLQDYRIKLFLLLVNNEEFCKFMMESIVSKNTPVREFKKQIIEEAEIQGIDCVLELDKMRLRKKTSRSLGQIYLDHQLIYKDVHVSNGSEMYVELLKEPDLKKHEAQRQVYVIRWHPSQCSVDQTDEIILDNKQHLSLKEKLSELSGIPVEYISVAKDTGSFPSQIAHTDIEKKLKWYSDITISGQIPFLLYDDGHTIYYKDNRES